MTTTSVHVTTDRAPASDEASDLLHAFAALPAEHPARPEFRARAVQAWLPMARRLAHRYARRGEPVDDLVQTAAVGLIQAVDRFDPGRGVNFVAYAVPTIVGEIKRHFRDRTWAVRVPRRLQERRLATNAAYEELTGALGRAPTVADLATHLGLSQEDVLEGLEANRAYQATSLSTPIAVDGSAAVGDTLGDLDHGYELAELRLTLGAVTARLTAREQRILSLRFYGNQTQTEIAGAVGISQMHVSRLITQALAKLRTAIERDVPGPGPRASTPSGRSGPVDTPADGL